MIDFRYHLVSIVSIFLALAVGIVLGAGPLQGEIGATLKDEVAGLRDDKAQLNDQLDTAQAGTEARDGYIAATNPIVLDGALAGRTVALVVLPGADTGVAESTTATLTSSGARITSTTRLTEDWVSTVEATTSVRDAVVTRVAGAAGVDLAGAGDTAPRDILLATLLARPSDTTAVPLDVVGARRALESLADADLLSLDLPGPTYERAALVVVVSGTVTQGEPDTWAETAGQWVDLTVALEQRSEGAVVAAAVAAEGEGDSVLETLRGDATAARQVSSVDDADDPMGQASISHALLGQIGGTVGHYGLAPDAEAAFAPVPTPTPSPTP